MVCLPLTRCCSAFGVIAGVSILGYSRFFIEAAQAFGRDQEALFSALLTTVVTAAILLFSSKGSGYEIGWSKAFGQTILFLMFKVIIGRIAGFRTPFLSISESSCYCPAYVFSFLG